MGAGEAYFVLALFLPACLVTGYTPSHYPCEYQWAEQQYPLEFNPRVSRLTNQQALERINITRIILAERGIHAYIVPSVDAHNTPRMAPADARREWLSGLTGSAGIAVVTATHALLWTDARYFTQFEIQVDTTIWTLMRQGIDYTIEEWLAENISPGQVVAVDPSTYTRSQWITLENALRRANVTLQAIFENLIDLARTRLGDPPPPRPNEPLIPLSIEFHGRRSGDKILALQSEINARGADALILTALDDIAYTLNLRGSDIPYNPVFFAYLIIRTNSAPNNVILFWGNGMLHENITQHLESEGTLLEARPYDQIFDYLRNMSSEPSVTSLWVPEEASQAIYLAAEGDGSTTTISSMSPVALVKRIKNEVELRGFRSAHVKDGIAVVRFLRWIHKQVDAGINVTEINVSDKLLELRGQEEHFTGPSFPTIAGAGANGAIIHYRPTREGPQRVITREDMLLVDSGGQYKEATTDITRTRHMGTPTEKQRMTFTRVLKGQINIRSAVFPTGIQGHVLDTLSRKPLWDVGLNFAHGTGHGVGHFLHVHEGPTHILASPIPNDPGVVAGMILSNEPGYYEVGEYGIRHEDLVEVIEMNEDANHTMADGIVGDFDGRGALAFYTISLAPHQTLILDLDLMTDFEIQFLNDYHARVLATLGPILRERNLTEDYDWLEKECAPIRRSGATLLKSTSLLALLGVFSAWLSM